MCARVFVATPALVFSTGAPCWELWYCFQSWLSLTCFDVAAVCLSCHLSPHLFLTPLPLSLDWAQSCTYSPLSILHLPLPASYFILLSPFISFQSLCCDVYFSLILLSLFSQLSWGGGGGGSVFSVTPFMPYQHLSDKLHFLLFAPALVL